MVEVKHGESRLVGAGMVSSGPERFGSARPVMAGKVGFVWPGFGIGTVWQAWYGTFGQGMARRGQVC